MLWADESLRWCRCHKLWFLALWVCYMRRTNSRSFGHECQEVRPACEEWTRIMRQAGDHLYTATTWSHKSRCGTRLPWHLHTESRVSRLATSSVCRHGEDSYIQLWGADLFRCTTRRLLWFHQALSYFHQSREGRRFDSQQRPKCSSARQRNLTTTTITSDSNCHKCYKSNRSNQQPF